VSESIIKDIQALRCLTVAQLRLRWLELYGEESRSRNKDFLFRRLAWRIQEVALGGLTDAAKTRILELAPSAFTRAQLPPRFDTALELAASPPGPPPRRDPRLPKPGSTIAREYRGQTLRLQVLDHGFELDGVHYDSLSEAARVVTGQRWNGPLFWGLRQRKRKR
jgi:hypothetical protein